MENHTDGLKTQEERESEKQIYRESVLSPETIFRLFVSSTRTHPHALFLLSCCSLVALLLLSCCSLVSLSAWAFLPPPIFFHWSFPPPILPPSPPMCVFLRLLYHHGRELLLNMSGQVTLILIISLHVSSQ